MSELIATWSIAGFATAGVIIRPARLPEAIWAVAGAAALVGFGLISPSLALTGVAKGYDVYLFLAGMMLLAEVARREGLFDWLARLATAFADGSPTRLFVLIYGVGVLVTALLSNDATAVVLTPAVLAAAAAARVADPMPYALICAFIANAASFVLPISNPANLVVFGGGDMPALGEWLARFAAPSLAAIAVTFVALFLTQRAALRVDSIARGVKAGRLSGGGRLAAAGVIATAALLAGASALGRDLGAPTAAAGIVTALASCARRREAPWALARRISWGVLPLVAGLFVLVEALEATGVVARLADELHRQAALAPAASAWGAGALLGLGSNLMNNLPAGLIAAATAHSAQASKQITGAMLIGVDLGPNLSITGSLATILWLHALRREGLDIGAWRFLKIGAMVMLPALIAALAALLAF
ncbi:MAG: arsenic transporter [Pseudomonadota bacterium]|nr:arsenic transporter [Pseudomonadota bacterium]